MPIDFNKMPRGKSVKRPIDPIELFQTLQVTDPAVNDLWLVQGETLRSWHSKRDMRDIAVILNTGAGKTLIGLLAAQSLVNETNGRVVYACSSIQLVEQTASKAEGYGLEVTTYFRQDFSNDLYRSGNAPCITTYHALFNGKSVFFRDDLSAIVFDDAHTAEHLLRDQFTLRISRDKFPDVFIKIVQHFKSYHARIGVNVGYAQTQDRQDPSTFWFVPPFAVHERLGELQKLLLNANLDDRRETLFAWEHVKNHIELCTLFISGQEIVFTPPIVPVRALPYFQKDIRRLYLSATMSARDAFLRTFGRAPEFVIAPKTTAGECERLIVIPSLHAECKDEVEVAKRITAGRKGLVLVPSNRRADQWSDIVSIQASDDVTDQVENFKKANTPAVLRLVSRYDGLDLPGDTCRLMIIDELPSGVGPLERYLWERLGLVQSLRSTVASRVTQSFGRISRGMSDHGVVILTGKSLIDWLLNPKNKATLPPFLRRQIELGIQVSKEASSLSDLEDAVRQCLVRDPGWIKYYQEFMRESSAKVKTADDQDAFGIAEVEVAFIHSLWSRDYMSATKSLHQRLDKTFEASVNTGAWHALWLGYTYELLGSTDIAHELYQRAHSAAKNIPPFDLGITPAQKFSHQIIEVTNYLRDGSRINKALLKRLNSELEALDGKGSAAQTEEALRALGEYLGLESSRPDKEFGTGPDVLWATAKSPALVLEVKTEKDIGSVYRKDDLGQLRDHLQWVREHAESVKYFPTFVGPNVPASSDSNPGADMVVIDLQQFKIVGDRLKKVLEQICDKAVPSNLEKTVLDAFQQADLIWPDLYHRMARHQLRDSKHT